LLLPVAGRLLQRRICLPACAGWPQAARSKRCPDKQHEEWLPRLMRELAVTSIRLPGVSDPLSSKLSLGDCANGAGDGALRPLGECGGTGGGASASRFAIWAVGVKVRGGGV